LKKNNVNVNYVEEKVKVALAKLPKTTGGTAAQTLNR
jgi:hypothetical protein